MLDFFVSLAGKIDINAEEVTINGSVVEENLYDYRQVSIEYKAALLAMFPELDITHLEQFGFQLKDDVSYKSDKMMLVFGNAKEIIHKYPEFSHVTNPHPEWCYNVFINQIDTPVGIKFFDLDYGKYELPALPPGAIEFPHVGVGQGNDGIYLGVYFGHTDTKLVSEFFGLPAPVCSEIQEYIDNKHELKVFGIGFNNVTKEVVKLKLYYYPTMSDIDTIIYDEIRGY